MKKQGIILCMMLLAALWGLPHRASAQIFTMRTNALAVCSATLNVGAETALNRTTGHWSCPATGIR